MTGLEVQPLDSISTSMTPADETLNFSDGIACFLKTAFLCC